MPSLPLYDIQKKKLGSIDVSDAVFAADVKPYLLNDAVRYQVGRKYEFRTANSLTRTEVQGTRKKMYRQKGTGQARHGDAKAPIFAGGGKAHGPKPRRVRFKLNKKVRRAALICALSLNQKKDRLFIIDKLELEKPSTKLISKCLKTFGVEKAVFVNLDDQANRRNFNLSVRNVYGAKFLKPEGVNVFDLLKYRNLVVSKPAIEKITERLSHV